MMVAVGRNLFAGTDDENVTRQDLIDGDAGFAFQSPDASLPRTELEKGGHRSGGGDPLPSLRMPGPE